MRLVAVLLLFLFATLGLAQDTLAPTWVKARANGSCVFSPDGKYVVAFGSGLNVWRASDGALVQRVTPSFIYAIGFSSDSKSLLMTNGSASILRYDFPSMVYRGTLLTDPGNTIFRFDASSDGKRIVYTTAGTPFTINLYDLTTSQKVANWVPPAGVTQAPKFTADGQKIYCDGPTLYDLTGVKLAGKTNYGFRPVANPIEKRLYQFVGSTGKLTAFSMSNLLTLWAVTPDSIGNNFDVTAFSVTADGKALCAIGFHGGYGVFSASAVDGSPLPSFFQPPNPQSFPTFALSSVGATAWLGYEIPDATYGAFGTAATAALDTSTGGGTLLNTVAPVHEFGSLATFSVSPTSDAGIPLLLGSNGALFGLNDGDPRAWLSTSPAYRRSQARQQALSPDGRFTASVGNADVGGTARSGLILYRNDTGAVVTTVADTSGHEGSDVRAVQWITPTRLVLKRELPSPKLSIYDFDGTKLTLSKSVACSTGVEMAVSSDGKKAVTGQNQNLLWTDLRAGTSTAFTCGANLDHDIASLRFVDGTYKFSVSYDDSVGMGFERTVDLYDGTGGTPTVVRSFHQPVPTPDDPFTYGLVSPDGKWVALTSVMVRDPNDALYRHRLTLYRASDGTVVRTYENQLLDYGIAAMEFSSDSQHIIYGTYYGAMVSVEVPLGVAVSVTPASIIGGASSTGKVTLERAASTDVVVALASNQPFASVPASVTVPAGQTSATFSIATSGVDATANATIVATYQGVSQTAALTVAPATALALGLNPTTVNAGQTSTGTVTLNGLAGPSGVVVSLASNNAAVTVPASVTVLAGQSSATFAAATSGSASGGTATITAKAGSLTGQATLTINASVSTDVTLSPTSTKGGNTVLLTVTLGSPAPAGGTTFTLSSDSTALAPPAKITVKAGSTTAVTAVRTKPVLADTVTHLTLSLDGGFTRTLAETVQAPAVTALFTDASTVASGDDVALLVVLDGAAASGFTAPASSNSALASLPASVGFAGGSAMALVTVHTTAFAGTANKKVTLKVGDKSISITLVPTL